MAEKPTAKQIFDPYEDYVTKKLDEKKVNNLSDREPKTITHSNIFRGLDLSQKESNLAHHFTTSSDNYIKTFNNKNPGINLPSNHNDIRLHLLGRFAQSLRGTASHEDMISLLDKLADKKLIVKKGPGQYTINKFQLKRSATPEETIPKSSTDVEETELASDVQPPVEENEEENEEEDKYEEEQDNQDDDGDDEELRKLLENNDTEDDELEKAFSTHKEEKETDPIKDKIHTLFLFKQNFSDSQKFLHYLSTHIDYISLISKEYGLTAEDIIKLIEKHNATS